MRFPASLLIPGICSAWGRTAAGGGFGAIIFCFILGLDCDDSIIELSRFENTVHWEHHASGERCEL